MQGAALLSMAFEDVDIAEGRRRMDKVLNNGEALDVFRRMCVEQGVEMKRP